MTGKSTHSNEMENTDSDDSAPDSEDLDAKVTDDLGKDDAPVVIEGEAEDVTDETIQEGHEDSATKDALGETSEEDVAEEESTDPQEEAKEPYAEPVPVAAAPEKRGSVVPLVFGGLIAGAIGFGASHFGVLESEQATETATIDTSAVEARLDELGSAFGKLNSGFAALAGDVAGIAPVDTAPLSERIDALTADVEALQNAPIAAGTAGLPDEVAARIEALETDVADGMSDLTDRMTGLEDRLADMQIVQESDATGDMAEEELAAFQSQLAALTSDATAQVEEAKARASEFEKEASKAAALAERQSAIAALTSAVESGSPFGDELGFLADAPEALSAVAESGMPTLSALQRDFPDAARAALSTATVVPQDASAGERLTAFLKRQTNARSLAPKEGDGTDAVLSRAEASVAQGDLEGSLAELSSLPEEAKEVLGPWMANAQARLDALSALSEISAAVN